jgi:GNAT superfamily N-acetyltransferase
VTEIRPIEADEAPSFLRLLCDVFQLDYDRAYGIFFGEPLFELQRKWALFEGREMVSVLTTVPLQFGIGDAFGIAGVATRTDRQREGHASKLLRKVVQEAHRRGCVGALLFAQDTSVYEKNSFEVVDRVIRGPLAAAEEEILGSELSLDAVQSIYAAWAERSPMRLRRDRKRWEYWTWNMRVCHGSESGYVCSEGNLVRECVDMPSKCPWPLPLGSEWLGLESMTRQLEVPVLSARFELSLMGIGFRTPPEMFMTDQF